MGSRKFKVIALTVLLSSMVLTVWAQDAAPGISNTTVAAASADNAQVSESSPMPQVSGQEMLMNEVQKVKDALVAQYTSVNERHEILKTLAGTWKATIQFWMEPEAKPEESEGTSEGSLIMGGRFLEQRYQGVLMGQPFEGRGILGYDNLKKEYTSIWFDSMATGIMTGSGQYNHESKILVAEGSMSCPMTQEPRRWYRDVTTIIDADNYTHETYMKDQRGVEYKSMAIKYSRIK